MRRFALLALLSGCSVALDIPDGATITCRSDADCPPSTACDARKLCRDSAAAGSGLPGFDVSPTRVEVGESGSKGIVNIRLTAKPRAAVTIVLAPDDGSEAFITPGVLTFTPEDYAVAKAVTVTGERDCLADGAITSHIIVSAAQSDDLDYSGIDPPDIEVVTNDDVPAAGITVTPTAGLTTSETGDVTQFTVVVACQPTADVHLALASSDETEGVINTSDLVFTPENWAVPRVITVSGRGDCAVDGDSAYQVRVGRVDSADLLYDGIDPPDVPLVNRDVAFLRVSISPNAGLRTTESGAPATFAVVLSCPPNADVTIPLTTADATEGTTGAVTSLTFTPANWNQPQSVIVNGVNDGFDDGPIAYSITTLPMVSSDAGFSGFDPVDIGVVNDDDDTASVTVTPRSDLFTTEAGGTATVTIQLGAVPMAPVRIAVTSTNTAEGTPATSYVDIADTTPVALVVRGVDDSVDDDDQTYSIVLGDLVSPEAAFNGLVAGSVTVKNVDDDTARVVATGELIENTAIFLLESGTTARARINLASKPLADVTVVPFPQEPSEFSIPAGTTLTFTPVNWQTFQYVTLTGKDDAVSDTLHVSALLSTTTSDDPKYNISLTASVEVIDPVNARRVYVTTGTYPADTVAPLAADAKCAASPPVAGTWKAAIVDAVSRQACATGCDWVFAANTTYYWSNLHGVLGVSNSRRTFDSSGPYASSWQGGPYGGGYYWTGLDDNFVVGATCSGWSGTGNSLVADVGLASQPLVIDTFSGSFKSCTQSLALLCVEQ